ncbi:MAG: caspase family protein, partial [Bradyrhizobium sp.]|nr:caspase family protein [Bradyrhizobium sp.]
MFRHALAAALLAGSLLAGLTPALAESSRLALVIGQSAYRSVMPLPNPANDANAMAKMLGEAGFDVTIVVDLSQKDLNREVGDFAAKIATKGPETVALVFYAGHGLQIDGENYL